MGFERPERTAVRPKEQARAPIHRKVAVGAADSPYEHEADRVAQQVMRRLDTSGGADPMSGMAHAFGADFGNVRLHTDSAAAAMSESLQARAFTHGSDVYFGAGQFQPGTRGGQELLAHELTHTIQQGAAPLVGSGADAPTADNGRAVRRAPLPSISRDSEGSVRRAIDPAQVADVAKRVGVSPGSTKVVEVPASGAFKATTPFSTYPASSKMNLGQDLLQNSALNLMYPTWETAFGVEEKEYWNAAPAKDVTDQLGGGAYNHTKDLVVLEEGYSAPALLHEMGHKAQADAGVNLDTAGVVLLEYHNVLSHQNMDWWLGKPEAPEPRLQYNPGFVNASKFKASYKVTAAKAVDENLWNKFRTETMEPHHHHRPEALYLFDAIDVTLGVRYPEHKDRTGATYAQIARFNLMAEYTNTYG